MRKLEGWDQKKTKQNKNNQVKLEKTTYIEKTVGKYRY